VRPRPRRGPARAALDRFLADPEVLVPGTATAMPPLTDSVDRRDVINYLQRDGR
jgi:cytochrome c2